MQLTKKKGFTLIEIVIVLAIAALILVIVFLAVGGAQRSRRDDVTKNAAARLSAQFENFANNGGTLPLGANLPGNYTQGIQNGQGEDPNYNNAAATSTAGQRFRYRDAYVCTAAGGIANTAQTFNGVTHTPSRNTLAITYWVESGNTVVCIDNAS